MNGGKGVVWAAVALAAFISIGVRAETVTIAQEGVWEAFGGTASGEGQAVCGVSQTMDGGRFVGLKFFRGDATFTLQIGSPTWKLKDDDKHAVSFTLGTDVWSTKDASGMHFNDGDAGLETSIVARQLDDFIRAFRSGSQMLIQFPGFDRTWQVSLAGSNAVIDAFERCRRYLKDGAPPLLSQSLQQCLGKKDSTADEQLEACNAVVASDIWRDKNVIFPLDWRGSAYKRKGDLERAIADYDKALRIDPNRAGVYVDRGLALQDKGELDRAAADYTEAIRLDPKRYVAYNNRGTVWKSKGDLDRAIADYGEALKINPEYVRALTNRGIAWRSKGDPDKAIADYGEALKIDPKNVNVLTHRGFAWQVKGDFDKAIADYSEAMQLDTKNAAARAIRGRAYFFKGDYAAAAADLLSAADLQDDGYTMIWRFLARSRAGQDAAGELSANAARLKTKDWPYAVIDFYLGRRSVDEMRAAAGNDGQKCEAVFYVGEWHVLHANAAEAKPLLQTAADTCPKEFVEYEGANVELKRLPK